MKRIFTIITVLITLSVAGLIFLQLSWLNNMVLLRQEQVKEKVNMAIEKLGREFVQIKEATDITPRSKASGKGGLFSDDSNIDFMRPMTIGKRFSQQEFYEKIKNALQEEGLEKIPFEFSVAIVDPGTVERQSANFAASVLDTVNNHAKNYGLVSRSGTAAENIAFNEYFTVVVLNYKNFAIKSLKLNFLTAILFSIIILSAFYLTVRTMLRQKKLGDIKNDFINNMTHEFKTPIATISLAVDAMRNEKVVNDKEKLQYFNSIIKEENQRMNRQVETILRASQLEKQEVDLALSPLHVHQVINDTIDNFTLQLEDKKGKVNVQLNAVNDLISADEVHFANLVNNLVDNAVKYAKENVPPVINISTQSNGKSFSMKIDDNGIGMSRDSLKRIFEKFYRAHTGNVHNVKGFGLGLSYVKAMIEAHHGEITADSTLGKGSTFIITLPLRKA